jgi:hypothetical protein
MNKINGFCLLCPNSLPRPPLYVKDDIDECRALLMAFFSLYVTIFTSPLDQGLSRAEPARYELPGKDLFLHTA